jgi:tetratricopeptide (TPR) repeat protein
VSDLERLPGLTRTGAAIGTPRYMAPEQRSGGEVTAQADQFGFCVALWEALFATHPFDDGNVTTPVAGTAVLPVAQPRPPRGHDVPARIVAALVRGLSPEPGDRWPSMAALLGALAPRRRRWIWIAAPVVAIAGVVALAAGTPTPPSCAAVSRERAALTSSPTRRARIHAGLVATGHPAALPLADRAMAAVDRYSARWAMAFTDGCTSARAGGAAAAASERRLACLDRHLQGLDGTLAALDTRPTRDLVNRAEAIIRALPDPDECVANDGEAQPPAAIAPDLARLTRMLAEANANLDAGRVDAAEALLATLVPEVARVGWGPLVVRTDLARTKVARVRGTGAFELILGAARRATTLRMELVAAEAWTEAVRVAGKERGAAEVDMLVAIARAQAERTGASHVIAAAAIAEGRAQASLDKPALSERTCRAALAALGDRADPRVEAAHASGAECVLEAVIALGRWQEAEAMAGELIARWRSQRPEQHPSLADYLSLRVTALTELGRADEALGPAEQALAIYRAALGPNHPRTVDALRDLDHLRAWIGKNHVPPAAQR